MSTSQRDQELLCEFVRKSSTCAACQTAFSFLTVFHVLALSLSLSHSLCLSVLYYATSCSWAAGVGGEPKASQ